jgi:hypothetical protein
MCASYGYRTDTLAPLSLKDAHSVRKFNKGSYRAGWHLSLVSLLIAESSRIAKEATTELDKTWLDGESKNIAFVEISVKSG